MLTIPKRFDATHETAGLPGYPARDFFGSPFEQVQLSFAVRCDRRSGRPCSEGGTPGGSYGESLYVRRPNGDRYYLTHLTRLEVEPRDWIPARTPLGRICPSSVSGKPHTDHVHVGFRHARRPPLWRRAARLLLAGRARG